MECWSATYANERNGDVTSTDYAKLLSMPSPFLRSTSRPRRQFYCSLCKIRFETEVPSPPKSAFVRTQAGALPELSKQSQSDIKDAKMALQKRSGMNICARSIHVSGSESRRRGQDVAPEVDERNGDVSLIEGQRPAFTICGESQALDSSRSAKVPCQSKPSEPRQCPTCFGSTRYNI